MRNAFTLIEMIFVLVISGVLSLGSFKAFESLYIRSAKAKAVTDLSLQSQVILDQLSTLIYNRIPNSVIGYDGAGHCQPIEALSAGNVVLEWLGLADDQLLLGQYDGFVDMNASVSPILSTPNISPALNSTNMNLIFSGAFDDGSEDIAACSGAFGWHGNDSNLSYGFNVPAADQIRFNPGDIPDVIYEKYYLTNSAYAVTRGQDVDMTSPCITALGSQVDANTLFLFYDFYPYNTPSQTYCADAGSGVRSGNVAILAEDVSGFSASYVNDAIRLSISMSRAIRGATDVNVSKEKAVF